MICPLCSNHPSVSLGRRKGKNAWDYYRCDLCGLHFRDPGSRPLSKDEKERYDQHQNTFENQGYRNHLSRILPELIKLVPPPADHLDFGCGPEAVLSRIMEESGYRSSFYDLYYYNDPAVLKKPVDLITSTEVFEHLYHPARVMDTLVGILPVGGILAVMTKPVPSENFLTWHYLNDSTHVVFYSEKTFLWIAERWELELVFHRDDLFYFRKK